MTGFSLLFCGVVVIVGLLWQRHLMYNTDPNSHNYCFREVLPDFIFILVPKRMPKRVVVPYLFGIVVVVGTIVLCIFDKDKLNTSEIFSYIWRAILFMALITMKSYFGPAVLSFAAAYSIHVKSITWLPFVKELLNYIFKAYPVSIYTTYSVIILIYVFSTSFIDTEISELLDKLHES